MTTEFRAFEKIPRFNREVILTEKIDGTNAQIVIFPANEIGVEGLVPSDPLAVFQDTYGLAFKAGLCIAAGSRSRYVLPGKQDNFGFAGWVQSNADALFDLGVGQHFGEWYGQGIQRTYDLPERRFALFNAGRWTAENVPSCVSVVPIVGQGMLTDGVIGRAVEKLREGGSAAVPGFMRPEGVIVFHTASRQLYKVLLENDGGHKGG